MIKYNIKVEINLFNSKFVYAPNYGITSFLLSNDLVENNKRTRIIINYSKTVSLKLINILLKLKNSSIEVNI
jgi:hypothetical protein